MGEIPGTFLTARIFFKRREIPEKTDAGSGYLNTFPPLTPAWTGSAGEQKPGTYAVNCRRIPHGHLQGVDGGSSGGSRRNPPDEGGQLSGPKSTMNADREVRQRQIAPAPSPDPGMIPATVSGIFRTLLPGFRRAGLRTAHGSAGSIQRPRHPSRVLRARCPCYATGAGPGDPFQ